ncbi:hypothetical protein CsSME_00051075 [Camellia sinensis var. sinensis]
MKVCLSSYGRVKPGVVAYGREIMGSKISTGCKSLSGTSVASPVVAGVVNPKDILNPASMKQALVKGAAKLSGPNMYEQGAGRVDLLASYQILKTLNLGQASFLVFLIIQIVLIPGPFSINHPMRVPCQLSSMLLFLMEWV